jgi:hypothetical protein
MASSPLPMNTPITQLNLLNPTEILFLTNDAKGLVKSDLLTLREIGRMTRGKTEDQIALIISQRINKPLNVGDLHSIEHAFAMSADRLLAQGASLVSAEFVAASSISCCCCSCCPCCSCSASVVIEAVQ